MQILEKLLENGDISAQKWWDFNRFFYTITGNQSVKCLVDSEACFVLQFFQAAKAHIIFSFRQHAKKITPTQSVRLLQVYLRRFG